MGEFIRVTIDQDRSGEPEEIKAWVRVCPVNVFELVKGRPRVVQENEDECTLCGLCLEACKSGAITIDRLYET